MGSTEFSSYLSLLWFFVIFVFFFFSSRRRHTRSKRDWSSDVCSSDLDRISPVACGCLSHATQHFRSSCRTCADRRTRAPSMSWCPPRGCSAIVTQTRSSWFLVRLMVSAHHVPKEPCLLSPEGISIGGLAPLTALPLTCAAPPGPPWPALAP